MAKKLTITVDAEVYDGLHNVVDRRRISRFLNDLARPHVVGQDLSEGVADLIVVMLGAIGDAVGRICAVEQCQAQRSSQPVI